MYSNANLLCGYKHKLHCMVIRAPLTRAFTHLRRSRPQGVGGMPRPALMPSPADIVSDKMSGSTSPHRMHNIQPSCLLAVDQRRRLAAAVHGGPVNCR